MVYSRWTYRLFWIALMSVSLLSCQQEEIDDLPVKEVQAAELLLPLTQAKEVGIQPLLQWSAVENATFYQLVISEEEDLSDPILDISIAQDTFYRVVDELNKSTNYYWTITAHLEDEKVLSTETDFTFRTIMETPQPSPNVTDYYVSPSGKDHPTAGTLDLPFKTLGYASRMIPAEEGDTIHLDAGTFVETESAILPLGVHVVGSGEANTILMSSGVHLPDDIDPNHRNFKLWYDGALILLVSPHTSRFRDIHSTMLPPENGNQSLRGFTIDGDGKQLKAGIWVENRHAVQLSHITFRDLAQRGAVIASGDKPWFELPEYYLEDIVVHDCTFINSGKDLSDESLGNLNIAQLNGAKIYNIKIQDEEGYGIKFIYDGYFKDLELHDCEIEVSETDNLWGEDIGIELWNLGAGNEVYNIQCNTWLSFVNHPEIFGTPAAYEQLDLHDIRIIDQDKNSTKEGIEIGLPGVDLHHCYIQDKGIGIAIWNMGRKHIRIRNSIFYNTSPKDNWAGGAAIYIDNSQRWDFQNIQIVNNVFDRHRTSINIKGERIKDIAIHNNAFFNTTTDIQAKGKHIVATHNIKYTAAATDWKQSGLSRFENNYLGDPNYQYSGERWATYYQPVDGGFAVDKGKDVGLSYSGNAPDIGFYEHK
ncbi:MAG: hypothetical protein AAGI23_12160 [Bacteroidota bacterium]